MRRRAFFAVGLLCLALAGVACTEHRGEPFAGASSVPASSRVPDRSMTFDSDRTGNFEIYTMETDGSSVRQLTKDPAYDSWWPRISPDRRTILFYRTPAGSHEDYSSTSLWAIAADGGTPTELRPAGAEGWEVQGHAEWSPTGDRLVMFGGSQLNPQIYVTNAEGGDAHAITQRGGQNLDPSWTPDGRAVVFVGCPRAICFPGSYEIYLAAETGGEPTRLTFDQYRDQDPYVSPDGSTVAWLTQSSDEGAVGTWGIRAASMTGQGVRWVIDDGNVNSYPAWSPDGAWIYFHRFTYPGPPLFSIYRIRPDGTDLHRISADTSWVDEYPSL